jgi:hypothetical protein
MRDARPSGIAAGARGPRGPARGGRRAAAIVDRARNLGLGVVAEGLEEDGQLHQLRRLGCSHGQGHLFAPAMRVPEVDAALAAPPADGPWCLGTAPAAGPGFMAA